MKVGSFEIDTSKLWEYCKTTFRPNFYRLHLSYFLTTILISSAILWGGNTSDFHVRYIDALFLCCSAMCNVGLHTINLGSVNGFQQAVLFVVMLLAMKDFWQHSKAGKRIAEDIEGDGADSSGVMQNRRTGPQQRRRDTRANKPTGSTGTSRRTNFAYPRHTSGYGGFPAPWDISHYRKAFRSLTERLGDPSPEHRYLSFEPSLDHKGRICSLTRSQEEELGGVEYRVLKLLTWLLPTYAAFWLFLIMVVMTPYAAHTNVGNVIRQTQPGSLSPAWWSVFASVSASTNCGLNLLNESMIPVSNNYLILIFTATVILAGSTLYPVFLRATIWLLSKLVPTDSETHHTLMFLLQHPRRCYPFLFPAKNTWALLMVQIAINLTAWVLWIILDINYTPIDPLIPPGLRVFQGLYQAHGLRASGFYITLISDVAPALQFFYLVVMYISAFPVLLSLRQTNVYDERSIGQDDDTKQQSTLNDPNEEQKAASKLGYHARKQLAYDLWWIILAVWLVSIIERKNLAPSPPAESITVNTTSLPSPAQGWSNGLFAILFETVSAYGTVGLSLGVPYDSYSFCGAWQSLSKLVLMSVMLRGRHRILPMAVDRAILLPGQDVMEEMDRRSRVDEEGEGRWEDDEREVREEERGVRLKMRGRGMMRVGGRSGEGRSGRDSHQEYSRN